MGLNAWINGRNAALSAAEYLTPVLTQSQFVEKGVLTPDEFVAAGDLLVLRCPTWQWQAGDPTKARPFLPPHKQFLLTKNVPSQQRASSLAFGAHEEKTIYMSTAGVDDEGWQVTHASVAEKVKEGNADEDKVLDRAQTAKSMSCPSKVTFPEVAATNDGEPAFEVSVDMVDDDPSALLTDHEHEAIEKDGFGVVHKTRTYDVSITYDKYYQSARVWLYGYSESRQPLTQPQILQDISVDHALKTVTLESHPHIADGAGLHASIHPCKHAHVMQKLCAELKRAGRDTKVDAYLFLFLKFISSVCPTIEYDYTIPID